MIEKTSLAELYVDTIKPYTDYIPVVSTATNLVDLFWHSVGRHFYSKEAQSKNYYFISLEVQPVSHYLLALVPVLGNFLLFVLRAWQAPQKIQFWKAEMPYLKGGGSKGYFNGTQVTKDKKEIDLCYEKFECLARILANLAWI